MPSKEGVFNLARCVTAIPRGIKRAPITRAECSQIATAEQGIRDYHTVVYRRAMGTNRLVIAEEEELSLNDWPTDAPTEVVIVVRILS